MATLQIIKYEGPRDVLVWKSTITDFNIGSILIVQEAQEAIFYRDGQALDLFNAGRHELETNNLPLLRKIYEKITRNPSTFECKVYYINKTISEELLWGTNTPIQLEDPKYGILINVKSFGSYKIQVEDSRKFLIKTIGSINSFSKNEIQDYFRNEMVAKVKSTLAKTIAYQGIGILEISAHLDDLSKAVKEGLQEVFSEYGLLLKQFVISNIKAVDEDLTKLKSIKESRAETIIGASSRKEAMDILGTNYKESETLDIMKEAAKNQAEGGLVGLGVGLGFAPGINSMVKDGLSNKKEDGQICHQCGAHLAKGLKFCGECGAKVQALVCPKCGANVALNMKFCGECGASLLSKKICSNCGSELSPGIKFCNECGTKAD